MIERKDLSEGVHQKKYLFLMMELPS